MKKCLSLLLALALIFTCVPAIQFQVDAAAVTSGTCGDNLTWVLNEEGTLTISGTGAMMEAFLWDGSIPWDAYRSQIKKVVVQPGATTIGSYMFADCSNLTAVELPEGIASINYCAFWNCYNLTDINLPSTLKYIDGEAFVSCKIKTLEIPEGVTAIYDSAFRNSGIEYVTIPASVTTISSWAFSSGSLKAITVHPDNAKFCSDANGALFSKDMTVLYQSVNINGLYVVPNTVKTIYDGAFECAYNLTGIVLPAGLAEICFTAFDGCNKLKDVYYAGTQEQKDSIIISEGLNDPIFSATWHYEVEASYQNGDAQYCGTLQEALQSATGTVTLFADVVADAVVLKPGVTLNLNGCNLTADLVVAMNGAKVTGNGLLKIAKGNLVLDQDNGGVIPVWNGTDGYVFTGVTFQQMTKTADNGAAQYIFLPTFTNADAAALMADGGLGNELKIQVCMTWDNGQSQQFYTYSDELVKKVFDGTGKWVFDLKVTGIAGIDDMVVQAVVVTNSGALAGNHSSALAAN